MFWIDTLPVKMKKYVIDPLIEYNPANYSPRTKQPNRPTGLLTYFCIGLVPQKLMFYVHRFIHYIVQSCNSDFD